MGTKLTWRDAAKVSAEVTLEGSQSIVHAHCAQECLRSLVFLTQCEQRLRDFLAEAYERQEQERPFIIAVERLIEDLNAAE